jgi:GR25 family glycosyltransferase involved in LPS biosynthesis
MISLHAQSKNVQTFTEWCDARQQTNQVLPGRKVASLEEARPWLTSYAWYSMHNWREGPCHFDTTGPIGCFLAHRDAWQVCVTRNEYVWIFEEGVYNYDSLLFDQIQSAHPKTDLIMGHALQVARLWKQTSMDSSYTADSLMMPLDKIDYGTKCYRLSPSFATKLLQHSLTFDTHVDAFICTEALMHTKDFTAARTRRFLVSATSSGTINHSIDQSLLIGYSLAVTSLLCLVGFIFCLRLYRKCRRKKYVPCATESARATEST